MVYSKEEQNGLRLACLLIEVGTLTVKKIFDDEVSNQRGLQHLLQQKQQHLTKKAGLFHTQKDLLYPNGSSQQSPTTSDAFDLTLLFNLYFNLLDAKKLIQQGKQHLDSLRQQRNCIYGHINTMRLSKVEFEQKWKELSGTLLALGSSQADIDKYKHETLDPESLEKYEKEIKKYLSEIKEDTSQIKQIKEDTSQIMATTSMHYTKMDMMYNTKLDTLISQKRRAETTGSGGNSTQPGTSDPDIPQMEESVYSEEIKNGVRFECLVNKLGRDTAKKIFDDEVSRRGGLQHLLQQNQQAWTSWRGKPRLLTWTQIELLYPNDGVKQQPAKTSDDFDITLLITLFDSLLGFPPPQGKKHWGCAPDDADKNQSANLVRLREQRNQYSHNTSIELTNDEFKQKWQELSDILGALGAKQEDINKYKNNPFTDMEILYEESKEKVEHAESAISKKVEHAESSLSKKMEDESMNIVQVLREKMEAEGVKVVHSLTQLSQGRHTIGKKEDECRHPDVGNGEIRKKRRLHADNDVETQETGTNHFLPDIKQWEYLGGGGFGDVYKVHNWRNKTVAVKRNRWERSAADKYIKKEMENLKRLSLNHPGLVQYYGSEKIDGYICLIMEYVPGGSLWDLIKESKGIPEKKAKAIIKQIVEALKFLHPKHVHRDLKPANVMISENGDVKLIDIGLTKILKETTDGITTINFTSNPNGTWRYKAPELINQEEYGKTYGPSVDIWSLGMIVVAMCTGEHPMSDKEDMAVIFHIGSRKELKFSLPDNYTKQVQKFVDMCLNYEPTERPSASELLKHPLLQM